MGDPSATPYPTRDKNSLASEKMQVLRLIKEVAAAGACHQEDTILVTYKIIKFLIKSRLREETGLGTAAGGATC